MNTIQIAVRWLGLECREQEKHVKVIGASVREVGAIRQQRTLREVRAAADRDSDGVLDMNSRTMQEFHRCFGHDFTVEEGFIVEDFHR